MVRLPGHVLPALTKATLVPSSNPKNENAPITLTIVLKHDDQAGFERYLHEIYDPHSKNFHHFLSQNQIADRFGPSRSEYRHLAAYLRKNGFEVTGGSKNRLTLSVRGTRGQAQNAFDLRIGSYRIGKRIFFANDRDPAVPADLALHLEAIAGLSNLATPHSNVVAIRLIGASIVCALLQIPIVNHGTEAIQNAYKTCYAAQKKYIVPTGKAPFGLDPPAPSFLGVDGTGQTIGLIEFDTFQQSDVADFLNLVGSPATQITNLSEVKVNGGASPGPNQDEVLLDIDDVMSGAPGAKVVVYDQPFTGSGASFQSLFNAAISGGSTIISNSWAYCEDETTLADVQSIDLIFQNAAAGGISIFNGSGDSGSTCLDGAANTVSVPADSPNATAVGGSSLALGPGATYGSETWWDGTTDTPPTGQGGFGVSKFFSAKSYQTTLSGTAQRSVPDVVANADPEEGVVICEASAGGCPTGGLYSGTSSSTPTWAVYAALLNQSQGTNLGFLNPLIYPFASSTAFHDAASMGSDFAHVGLGSPNVRRSSSQVARGHRWSRRRHHL